MRVGLIGPEGDPQVTRLTDRLADRGVEPVVLDLTRFPDEVDLELRFEGEPELFLEGQSINEVGCWYARRLGLWDPNLPKAPDRETWMDFYDRYEAWHAAETERSILAGSLLAVLDERSAVVNPPAAIVGHLRKHHQLAVMRAAGVPVPGFTVTNDPDAAIAFAKRHDRVVYKPTAGHRHVTEVTPATIEERREALSTEPIVLQRLVKGDHHRVHVVGDELVAAGRIAFDQDAGVDYRASEQGVERVDLPPAAVEDAHRAMAACGMRYTGLDLILEEVTGEHWILECNPAPMFAAFEDETGRPSATPSRTCSSRRPSRPPDACQNSSSGRSSVMTFGAASATASRLSGGAYTRKCQWSLCAEASARTSVETSARPRTSPSSPRIEASTSGSVGGLGASTWTWCSGTLARSAIDRSSCRWRERSPE